MAIHIRDNLLPFQQFGEGDVTQSARHVRAGFLSLSLALSLAVPANTYDFPLTSNAIRDAYFLGSRQGNLSASYLAKYSRRIPELHQGSCTSEIRIETPFLQIATYASQNPNYTSQDAVRDFYDQPFAFRMFLDICYKIHAPAPNSIKIKVIQNKREVVPGSDTRSFYAEPLDELSTLPSNGERAKLEFDASKLDSSALTIRILTPDGQQAECNLDLQVLR